MIETYLMPFVALLCEMAPYLLLGFMIAGILHAFVPRAVYRRYLAGSNTRCVVNALLLGIPLPLCSCGVIPTAIGMRKDGASKGATTAFLIATPQTGVDSILATYSVLGLPFAILRPVVALVTGLFGGIISNIAVDNENIDTASDKTEKQSEAQLPTTISEKCREAIRYGFTEMLMDIGKWLITGLVLAGLITIFVPDNFFTTMQSNYLLNMLIVLLIAVPMYVCATGSIPVAAALMLKGLSPGAALVFLMAGPATNMASMMVLRKTLGRKSLIVYLSTIIFGAIGFGIIADTFMPTEWFSIASSEAFHSACCQPAIPWWQITSAIVLMALLLRALFMQFASNKSSNNGPTNNLTNGMKAFKVEGMMCNHCRAHVQHAIESVEGVTSAEVDLASGTVNVEGTASETAIIAAVTDCGYKCTKQ